MIRFCISLIPSIDISLSLINPFVLFHLLLPFYFSKFRHTYGDERQMTLLAGAGGRQAVAGGGA